MAEINWGLLQVPDIGGNALAAFDRGRQMRAEEKSKNALATIFNGGSLPSPGQTPGIGDGLPGAEPMGDPMAQAWSDLAAANPEMAFKVRGQQQEQQQQLTEQQHKAASERIGLIGQAAEWADTPQKWDSAIDYLAQQYPELAQYKGKFSPEVRMSAIASAGQLKEYLDRQKPVSVGPGTHLVDPSTGKPIFSAPFAPRPVTVGEGQTVVEYTPGAGSNGGGLSPESLLPAIVAQESGGNYAAVNRSSGAMGAYQVMPATGQALAAQLGLPWHPELMTADTPEARQYQDAIGVAAVKEAVDNSGGDPVQAAMYYHGGSDRAKWGPKTQQYGQEVAARLGGSGGPKIIARGPPKQEKPKDAPAGYRWKADGSLEPIPGGPAAKNDPKSDPGYSQSAMDAFNRAIDSADRLLTHPGFSSAVGVKGLTGGLLGGWTVPGTDAADFKAELGALKAQVFLPMVQSMKGMGALSNAEGEKLTASIGALDQNMSEGAFKASLQRIITDLKNYRDRSGGPKEAAPQPRQSTPARKPSVSNW